MGETALDRLRKQKNTINQEYSLEEQMESSNDNQLDADSLVLTQMSDEALSTLKKKRLKPEKVEVEVEKSSTVEVPVIEDKMPEQSVIEESTPVVKKREVKRKAMSRDKIEFFIHSLALDLLVACKKQDINFRGFSEEQINIIWDYISEKLKENE